MKDKFSIQSNFYKKFRPHYPAELYKEILKHVENKHKCWDCATGNGQVAVELAKYFDEVRATDISAKQLQNAEKRDNIIYSLQRAETTDFKNNSFDLVTVGQAAHWFDLKAFEKEVKRVAKPEAILCVWMYGLLRINRELNTIIDHFYKNIIGPYWDEERNHIERKYETIRFDFEEIPVEKEFFIRETWNAEHLIGYLNSWSAVQNYKEMNGSDPVDLIIEDIRKSREGDLEVEFPLYFKMWKVE